MNSQDGAVGVDGFPQPAHGAIELAPAAASPAGRRYLGGTRRDWVARRLLAAADLAAAACAMLGSIMLAGGRPAWVMAVTVPLIVLMGKLGHAYDRDYLLVRKSTLEEAPTLFRIATLYALVVWLVHGVGFTGGTQRRQLAILWMLLFLLLLVFRQLARTLVKLISEPERCVVIGGRATAERIDRKLSRMPSLHSTVVGRIEPDPACSGGIPASLTTQELEALIRRLRADRIVVTHGWESEQGVSKVLHLVSSLGVKVSVLPSVLEVVGSAVEFDDVEGMPLLAIRRLGLSRSSRIIKRVFDVSLSAVGLLLAAPLMAVLAVAIKLDSPGPVFFRQRRTGKDGHPFEMLKLRTMVADAEERKQHLRSLNEPTGLFKIADDPRITRLGAWLRRTALDELPQLVNVLRGEMSLVGPRPLVAEEDGMVEGWHRKRLQLMPGVTGHWQVLGAARVPLDEMVGIDYLYVTNWSLWLDVKILLRTVPYVLGRRGM